jgi:hypothetical protein
MMRPRERLPDELAAGLPLYGKDTLSDADIAVLIRPAFHEDPRFIDPEMRERFARRGAALLAIMALAGIKDTAIARLNIDDYDPVEAMIRVKVQTRNLELPVVPALKWVLDEWALRRPKDRGDKLFPSDYGDPGVSSIGQFARHLGWRLGAQRQLSTMLFAYHKANLAGGPPVPTRLIGELGSRQKLHRLQRVKRYGRLCQRPIPSANNIPFLTRPHRAAQYFRRADTSLPMVACELGEPSKFGRRLDPDHPIVVGLAATLAVRGRVARIEKRDEFFDRHWRDIDELVASKQVPLMSLVSMSELGHRAFKRKLKEARNRASGAAQPRPKPPPRPPVPPKPELTPDEARRIEAILAIRWPRVDVEDFRRETLRRHFSFVRGLLLERKITYKRAQKLFRLTNKAITLRCFDFDNGLFHLAIAPRPGFEERRIALALAQREYGVEPGQSLTTLWKKLRLNYHYPVDYPNFATNVYNFVKRGCRPSARAPSRKAVGLSSTI